MLIMEVKILIKQNRGSVSGQKKFLQFVTAQEFMQDRRHLLPRLQTNLHQKLFLKKIRLQSMQSQLWASLQWLPAIIQLLHSKPTDLMKKKPATQFTISLNQNLKRNKPYEKSYRPAA